MPVKCPGLLYQFQCESSESCVESETKPCQIINNVTADHALHFASESRGSAPRSVGANELRSSSRWTPFLSLMEIWQCSALCAGPLRIRGSQSRKPATVEAQSRFLTRSLLGL